MTSAASSGEHAPPCCCIPVTGRCARQPLVAQVQLHELAAYQPASTISRSDLQSLPRSGVATSPRSCARQATGTIAGIEDIPLRHKLDDWSQKTRFSVAFARDVLGSVPMQVLAQVSGRSATALVDVSAADTGEDVLRRLLGPEASCSGRRPSVWAGSKKLRLSQPLAGQGVRPLSLLTVTGRLAGGGGDGGSTGAECRTAYLEMYKRKTVGALDAAQEALARWTRCSLSGEPLSEPVVADELGSLYNKEAVVRGLVEQLADGPKLPPHLTLKTIIDLKLARNPAYAGDGAESRAVSPFCCPITGAEFTSKNRFVVVRKTGHVVAEKAFKELRSLVEELAGSPVTSEDVMVLNGTEAERAALAEGLKDKLAKLKVKKAKKDKRNGKGEVPVQGGVEKKKWVAEEHVPEGATKEVYASLFIGKKELPKESYTARGTLGRGVTL